MKEKNISFLDVKQIPVSNDEIDRNIIKPERFKVTHEGIKN